MRSTNNDTQTSHEPAAVRLSKRVAHECRCSRAEAERHIVSGRVSVDGVQVRVPQDRVLPEQKVAIDQATQLPQRRQISASVVWFKPEGVAVAAGVRLALPWIEANLAPDHRQAAVGETASRATVFQQSADPWRALNALQDKESGMQLLTQDPTLWRYAHDLSTQLEEEWLLDLAPGAPHPDRQAVLSNLQVPVLHQGRTLMPARASWQSDTRIRLALKGAMPGQLEYLIERSAIPVLVRRRQRLGRLSVSGLTPGQWRTLHGAEKL